MGICKCVFLMMGYSIIIGTWGIFSYHIINNPKEIDGDLRKV
jgi:hypothetical protein